MVITALTTLIGNRDNDVPKEGDLQDVPLHSSDNQDPQRVFDPTPKGKQLPAIVAELMYEGEWVLPENGEFTSAKVSHRFP